MADVKCTEDDREMEEILILGDDRQLRTEVQTEAKTEDINTVTSVDGQDINTAHDALIRGLNTLEVPTHIFSSLSNGIISL